MPHQATPNSSGLPQFPTDEVKPPTSERSASTPKLLHLLIRSRQQACPINIYKSRALWKAATTAHALPDQQGILHHTGVHTPHQQNTQACTEMASNQGLAQHPSSRLKRDSSKYSSLRRAQQPRALQSGCSNSQNTTAKMALRRQ